MPREILQNPLVRVAAANVGGSIPFQYFTHQGIDAVAQRAEVREVWLLEFRKLSEVVIDVGSFGKWHECRLPSAAKIEIRE